MFGAASRLLARRPFGVAQRFNATVAKPVRKSKKSGNALPIALGTSLLTASAYVAISSDEALQEDLSRKWFDLMEFLEEANDRTTEFFTEIGDMIIATDKTKPLLPDLADMGYPEYLPTLVLDMDKVFVYMEHDRRVGWQVIKRPGADQFFKELQMYYEIVIFSDEMFPVAQDIVSKWNLQLNSVLHRDSCIKRKEHYIKDISRLGRKMEKMIVIDHDPVAMSLNPENGITIKPFTGDTNDTELFDLIDFLKSAATQQTDMRTYIDKFGGGDEDLGKRFLLYKKEQEERAAARRGIGKAFMGGMGRVPPRRF